LEQIKNKTTFFTDFKEITKAGLAISVVFSSLVGYLLGFSQNQ
jgi:protoheme IX farnesyltransferase